MYLEEKITFAEIYGVSASKYENTSITMLPFSVRVVNRFMSNGITTAAALLETTPQQLLNIKGFGKTCLEEINAFCLSLESEIKPNTACKLKGKKKVCQRFGRYKKRIAQGDFSFLDQLNGDEEERFYVDSLKAAYDMIGGELVGVCIYYQSWIHFVLFMKNSSLFRRSKSCFGRFQSHVEKEG